MNTWYVSIGAFALANPMNHFVIAQGASTMQASPRETTRRCELHVWPSEQLSGHGLYLYNGLIRGRSSTGDIEKSMDDLLTPKTQMSEMHDQLVATSLGLPSSTLVIEHQTPLDHKTVSKFKDRRSESKSKCYFELIMTSHSLIEDIVWGDRFSSKFLFRNFGPSMTVKNTVKGVGGNKLKIFTLSEQLRRADAPKLVAESIRANFLEYAQNARPKITSTINR